jgi:hypothetical protein
MRDDAKLDIRPTALPSPMAISARPDERSGKPARH